MPRWEEFKYSKSSPRRRCQFLEELRRYDVVVRASAANKALISGRPETAKQDLLYRDLVLRTVVRHRHDFAETELVLDEYIRGRPAQRQFNALLRQAVNTEERRRLADIGHQDSRSNNLLQAADMVAGAIYRARAHNDLSLLTIIQPRVREIWDWDGVEEPGDPASESVSIAPPSRRKKRPKKGAR